MPKVRKRKTPVTVVENGSPASSKPHSTRTVIRRFHFLLKREAQLSRKEKDDSTLQALEDIKREMDSLGGLNLYQSMSSIGQGDDRGGGSEKMFIGWLKELSLHKRNGMDPIRLLEVGALRPDNYASCSSWISNTPLDLHSRHPSILEGDFLAMNHREHKERWDAISLSLVVNFVPDPKDRGNMLFIAHDMLVSKGLLFLALPSPCVSNSRYLTTDHLRDFMMLIGFKEIKTKWTERGKMAYWLYEKSDPDCEVDVGRFVKKVVLRQGNRNNFAIQAPAGINPSVL